MGWMRQTGTAQYAAFSPHLYEVPQEMFGTLNPHAQGNMTIPTPPEDYPSDVFGLGQDGKKTGLAIGLGVLSAGALVGAYFLLPRVNEPRVGIARDIGSRALLIMGTVGLALTALIVVRT